MKKSGDFTRDGREAGEQLLPVAQKQGHARTGLVVFLTTVGA